MVWRILLLQHAWDDTPGYVGYLLQQYAIPFDVVDVEKEVLPDPCDYSAVIALGGPQHVYESEQYPYFVQERALLQRVVEQNIPYLGICLGGQLLADTFGGKVKRHTVPEFGFYTVQFTEEGQRDPLFAGLPGYQKVLHWHEDTFDLPEGAVLLATSENTENQAFRYSERAYGIQYHIEIDDTTLDTWLYHPLCKESILQTLGQAAHEETEQARAVHFPLYHQHTRILLQNFLRLSGLEVETQQE